MAYGNFRPQSGGYGQRAYQQGGGFRQNYQQQGYQGGQPRKYSGCKSKPLEDGKVFLYGWIKSYGQFNSWKANPAKKKVDTKNPRVKRMVVEISPANGAPYLTNGFYNLDKRVLSIPDKGWVCDPQKDYTYRYGRKRR